MSALYLCQALFLGLSINISPSPCDTSILLPLWQPSPRSGSTLLSLSLSLLSFPCSMIHCPWDPRVRVSIVVPYLVLES